MDAACVPFPALCLSQPLEQVRHNLSRTGYDVFMSIKPSDLDFFCMFFPFRFFSFVSSVLSVLPFHLFCSSVLSFADLFHVATFVPFKVPLSLPLLLFPEPMSDVEFHVVRDEWGRIGYKKFSSLEEANTYVNQKYGHLTGHAIFRGQDKIFNYGAQKDIDKFSRGFKNDS